MSDAEISVATVKAGKEIQAILLRLTEAAGRDIYRVEVDTRNFANLHTDIILEPA